MEMGSRDALSDEILADARKKAEREAKRAERDAKQILSRARKQADAATDKVLDAARERAERQARSVLATVEQDIRRDLLEAQEAVLDGIFRQALDRAETRKGYHYPQAMVALAAEAVAAMDADEVLLGFADGCDRIATDEWLADVTRRVGRPVALRVADEPEAIDGGVVARSADGRLVYDNSFAARLARLRPALRREVAAIIYPEAQ
jgi:vacuolar-type H+-ATPase subunit E/Vma4